MRCDKASMLLYAVSGRTWCTHQTLVEQAELCLKGGATCLQYREKDVEDAFFLSEAKKLKALCLAYHVPFIINDHVEMAAACDADGVHVGQSDMQICNVRAKLGSEKIIGVSVQTLEQAVEAQMGGADYLGVGAVFPTTTKNDADLVSIKTLGAICKAVTIPVVAIGGIDAHNALRLKGTGIGGIAVISAIFAQQDIVMATRQMLKVSREIVLK